MLSDISMWLVHHFQGKSAVSSWFEYLSGKTIKQCNKLLIQIIIIVIFVLAATVSTAGSVTESEETEGMRPLQTVPVS